MLREPLCILSNVTDGIELYLGNAKEHFARVSARNPVVVPREEYFREALQDYPIQ